MIDATANGCFAWENPLHILGRKNIFDDNLMNLSPFDNEQNNLKPGFIKEAFGGMSFLFLIFVKRSDQ